MRSSTIILAFCAAALTLQPAAARAQARFAPTKPVTIVVPYPPGGSNDNFARTLGKRLSDVWKQPVVIDNRPGANGSIGAAAVARAAPDGYTLMLLSSSFTTNAAIQKSMPFDPVTGFAPVGMVAKGPLLLTVSNPLPAKSLAELLALAKAQPGKLNYGSSGTGSINHFATEVLMDVAGIKMTHVPYKGMAPAVTDIVGGHVDVLIASAPSIQQHVKAGKVRGLGVTSPGPSAVVPELPSLQQSGMKGYSIELWWGVLAPAGTPPDVVAGINAELNRLLAQAEVKEVFLREGAEAAPTTPQQFAATIRDEIEQWKKVARAAGITAD